jgi:DinB superfamily
MAEAVHEQAAELVRDAASARAAELADDFAVANADAIAFVRSCDESVWALPVPGEGWSVGVVLHHVAEGHRQGRRWLSEMTSGAGVTDTAADIDRANAAHAVRAEDIGPEETAALLERNGALLESALRALSDDDLDRAAPFGPAGGREFPTADLAAMGARHTREHLSHVQQAVRLAG